MQRDQATLVQSDVGRTFTMIRRLTVFALLWWLLTGGSLENWPLGLLVIVISAGISTAVTPAPAWSATGLITFVPFFMWHSFKGGLDVGSRTLHRSLPLNPEVIIYRVRLPLGPARLFFANTINLLPGTLCAEFEDEQLSVHVLDGDGGFRRELESLEYRVARLFNISLASDSGEDHAAL